MTNQSYDLVVIGGGLAGLTAGMFSARYGRSTLVLESLVPGGHLINVETIEDFPGFPNGIPGYDLAPTVHEQAEKAGAEFQLAEVTALEQAAPLWRVVTSQGDHLARAVVVASGMHPRPLVIPGEESLHGRGVSHCATCDGPLFRGKPVAVAAGTGSSDHALQEALTLANHASHVTILNPASAFTAQHTYLQRVAEHPKIEARHNVTIQQILGQTSVTALRLRDTITAEESQFDVNALFVYFGLDPNTSILPVTLPLAEDGRIPTDARLHTALPGIFAAGDIRQHSPNHALTAAADGATAAISAHHYLTALG